MLSIEAIDDLSSRISGFILKALILGSLLADFFVVAPLPSGQDCRQGLKLNRPAGNVTCLVNVLSAVLGFYILPLQALRPSFRGSLLLVGRVPLLVGASGLARSR
jgi:hypothetical protein